MAYAELSSLLLVLPPLLERNESRFRQKHEALQIVDGRLQIQAQGRAYDALAAHELAAHLGQRAEHVLDACTRRGNAVTFRNRCDVLEITATTGREVAKSTSSCSVTLATRNFRYRPKAVIRDSP